MLEISLFDRFQARIDGKDLPDIHLFSAQRLLVVMALQRSVRVRSLWVADALWPGTLNTENLRKAIQHLRKSLGAEGHRLRTINGEIQLDLQGVNLDILHFSACIDNPDCVDYSRAIALHTGPLLNDWADHWVISYREGFENKFASAVDHLVEVAIARREHDGAARILRQAVTFYPRRESWWITLVESFIRAGNRVEALESIKRYRLYLEHSEQVDEIKLPPAIEIVRMLKELKSVEAPIQSGRNAEVAIYEPVGGAMRHGSRFYVERPEDHELIEAVLNRESIALIKGSHQTGKSSLMLRALRKAQEEGALILRTPWDSLPVESTANILAFYQLQVAALSQKAGIEYRPMRESRSSYSLQFDSFIRDDLLSKIDTPIVWAIDDADGLFDCPFRDDVFGLFRSWHNKRASDHEDPLNRFSLLMTYSAEAHLAIKNLNQSPFNVGVRVTLSDFTLSQVQQLNDRYGAPLGTNEQSALFQLTAGHPYLLRKAFYAIRARGASFHEIMAYADTEHGIFIDHLNHLLNRLLLDDELTSALKHVLRGERCAEIPGARLFAAGILQRSVGTDYKTRCELYDSFLRKRLL